MLVNSRMPTYSRLYLEFAIGMSSNGMKRLSLGPSIVSKIVYLADAFYMLNEGTVLSVVLVAVVRAVCAVSRRSRLSFSLTVIPRSGSFLKSAS